MIKKYFALSLITAALMASGCSSSDDDDDDDNEGTTTAATTAGGTDGNGGTDGTVGTDGTGGDDGGTPEPPVTDMSTTTGNSILDGARGTLNEDGSELTPAQPALTSLVTTLNDYPALLNALDNEDGTAMYTVFAPTNDAFTAAQETLATLDADAIENILSYHVVSGDPLDTSALPADAEFPMTLTTLQGATLEVNRADDGSFTATDSAGNAVALSESINSPSNGVVYTIDSILAAPAAMAPTGGDTGSGEPDGGDDGTMGGGTGAAASGSALAAIQGDGNLSSFAALVESSSFSNSLQDPNNSHFIVFAPRNSTIDSSVTSVISYINSSRPSTTTGEAAPGDYNGTGTGALSFTIAGEGDSLTVNGSPAVYVETQSGGALYVYGD